MDRSRRAIVTGAGVALLVVLTGGCGDGSDAGTPEPTATAGVGKTPGVGGGDDPMKVGPVPDDGSAADPGSPSR